jgi:Ca-activated chloride channel family protein
MKRLMSFPLVAALAAGFVTCSQTSREADSPEEVHPSGAPSTAQGEGQQPVVDQSVAGRLSVARKDAVSTAAVAAYEYGLDLRGRYNRNFNTESYGHLVENPFLAVAANPLSTFSIDVDRASYGNVRRFITTGHRPPTDAVRIEELVNYFSYDYPDPGSEHPFSITTEVTAAPWNPLHRLVRIGLQGRKVDVRDLPPSNLVFLIDVSGSMQSPDKLPLRE